MRLTRWFAWAVLSLCGVAALYVLSRHNYLLFHSLVELATVVVGVLLFSVAARMYSTIGNSYLMVLGIGFFWAAVIDSVHMLAYKGMGVFPGSGADLPTQLWILARYIQAATVLLACAYIRRRLRRWWIVFLAVGAAAALGLVAVFVGVFPTCYVDGIGLTGFKVVSEYVISALLVASLVILVARRESLDRWTYLWLGAALGMTVAGELLFTLYISVYGISNLVGHVFKLAAYGAILAVVLRNMLAQPVRVMRELTPICSACKAVRVEGGTWVSIEAFLSSGTQNAVTHGLCPKCMVELYPEFSEDAGETGLNHDRPKARAD